ncbi:MAG: LPS export ABC transporter periplasmic protein LptC [Treponema sp.]|jgi:LPS export ABC transporter protein LptC|nr:LPS export ABC transporter periplasmic protein LptC [Treponema sp.]
MVVKQKHFFSKTLPFAGCCLLAIVCVLSCTFDYGDIETTEGITPDLVMENVEYVRVRSAEPIARFTAERAERYEKQSLMKLENISFEQFGETVEEVNATGIIGNATIEIDSGNIIMDNGVRIEVESEDIAIETQTLEWIDEPKSLSAGDEDEVAVSMSNGSRFSGIGFFADTRRRTWEFAGSVSGIFIVEDEDEEEYGSENEIEDEDEAEDENI